MIAVRDRFTLLALVGVMVLVGQILFFGPLDLWARNAPFMNFAGIYHVAAFGLASAAVVAAAMAVWRLAPPAWRLFLAPVIAGAAIVAWVYAQFLFVEGLQLNGRPSGIAFSAPLGLFEFPAIVATIAALAWISARWTREVIVGLAILLAAQSALLGLRLASTWTYGQFVASRNLNSLWRVSTAGNVIVILLDTLQSDVAREALSDPQLSAQFDGFTLFTDATSVAPSTYPSMPVIHSGAPWDPDKNIVRQYQANVRDHSFLTQLARAGYDTAQINPIVGICADRVALCTHTTTVIGRRWSAVALEVSRLFDLSLLRTVPHYFKSAIYDGGQLSVTPWLARAISGVKVLNDIRLLSELAGHVSADDGPKTAKFIHLFSTHPPFLLMSDCRSIGPEADDGAVIATTCSFREIAKYLAKLKAVGVFDNTLLVILADHGGMRPVESITDARLSELVSHATPTLLVKFPGARGALRESPVSASVMDVAATVCEAVKDCRPLGGIALQRLSAERPTGRHRTYRHYQWRHEYWSLGSIPGLELFEIAGQVRDRFSWRQKGPARHYALDDTIDFRDATVEGFLALGWADAEPWGRWTVGPRASLRLAIDGAADADLKLFIRAGPLLGPTLLRQNVAVTVNGVHVGDWSFDQTGLADRSVRIPVAVAKRSPILEVDLDIQSPTSAAELGTNQDRRKLGIAVVEARLTADRERGLAVFTSGAR